MHLDVMHPPTQQVPAHQMAVRGTDLSRYWNWHCWTSCAPMTWACVPPNSPHPTTSIYRRGLAGIVWPYISNGRHRTCMKRLQIFELKTRWLLTFLSFTSQPQRGLSCCNSSSPPMVVTFISRALISSFYQTVTPSPILRMRWPNWSASANFA